MMKCNVGKTEQYIRIGVGIALVLSGIYYKRWWGLIGLGPIITGALRYCPVNEAVGISNCSPLKT